MHNSTILFLIFVCFFISAWLVLGIFREAIASCDRYQPHRKGAGYLSGNSGTPYIAGMGIFGGDGGAYGSFGGGGGSCDGGGGGC